jgi:MFS family permease
MREPSPDAPLSAPIVRRFRWASLLTGVAFGLEISALPLYFLTLGLPPPLYGLLVGAAWLVALVVRVPIGALALRRGNRPLLGWGCLSYAPLSWALMLGGFVPLFFLVRLANGVARSLMILPLRSWFTELCPRARLSDELGKLNAWYVVGQQLLGLLGGPLLLTLLGPRGLLGLLGLLPLLIWWLVQPAPPDHPAASARASAGRGQPALLLAATPAGLTSAAATGAIAAFVPPIVLELGWPRETVGLLLFVQGACAVALSRQNGPIVARWGEATPALVGLVFVIVSSLALYLEPGALALPLVMVLSGAAAGTLPTLAMGMCARALPSRSRGISVHETYMSLGLGAGPALGGLTTAWLGTPRAAMLGCLVFAVAGVALVLRVRAPLRASPLS